MDDHHVLREGIRSILDTVDGILVVGEADSGEKALELTKRLDPDVVLMDINMPEMSGLRRPDASAPRALERQLWP